MKTSAPITVPTDVVLTQQGNAFTGTAKLDNGVTVTVRIPITKAAMDEYCKD